MSININNLYDNDRNEKLFWKIVKNKVLFKEIILNLNISKTNINYKKYDSIIHSSWIIENKHLELLRYKVKRGDLLVCGSPTSLESKKDNFFRDIFIVIKSNVDDDCIEFYKSLFKNYKQYISNIDELVHLAIEEGNLAVIKILTQYYNFKPTIHNTLRSVSISPSLKTVKYLFGFINNQDTEKQAPILFDYSLVINNMYTKSYKVLHYLIESNTILIDKKINQTLFSEKIKNVFFDNDSFISIYKIFRLKDLVNACNLVLAIQQQQQQQQQQNENISSYKTEFEIIKLGFTKQQLQTNLKNLMLNKSIKNEHQNSIKKLLNFYLSLDETTQILNLPFYFFQYGGEQQEVKEKIENLSVLSLWNGRHFMTSLKYGSIIYWKGFSKYLEKLFKSFFTFSPISMVFLKFNEKENPNILFKRLNNNETDREKKKNFITSIINLEIDDYNNRINSDIIPRSKLIILLYLIIEHDDLELLQLFGSTLNSTPPTTLYGLKSLEEFLDPSILPPKLYSKGFQIQRFIKSIPILEFCFQHYINHFYRFNIKQIYYFHFFNSVKILKRYQELVLSGSTTINRDYTISKNFPNNSISKKITNIEQCKRFLLILKFAISTGTSFSHYEIDFNIVPKECTDLQFKNEIFDEIKFLYKNSNINCFPKKMIAKGNSYQLFLIYEWLRYENITKISDQEYNEVSYLSGNILRVLNPNPNKSNNNSNNNKNNSTVEGILFPIFYYGSRFGDVNILTTFKEHLKINTVENICLYQACSVGQLNVLKLFFSGDFEPKFTFSNKSIKELISVSTKNSHHHITKYLKGILNNNKNNKQYHKNNQ